MKKSRPDIIIVLAVLIGLGVIVTEIAQAFSGKDEVPATTVAAANR